MARKKDIEEISFEEVHEIQKYGNYYSEESFWKKIAKVAKKMGATVIRPALTLYFVLRDEKVPAKHKAYIIGALGYFIMPIDLIPEAFLSVVGFTDDLAVLALVTKLVQDSITPEVRKKVDQTILDLFPDSLT